MDNFSTDQEKFWAGDFGDNYVERNQGEKFIASNLNFFSQALQRTHNFENCIEFGANIGKTARLYGLSATTLGRHVKGNVKPKGGQCVFTPQQEQTIVNHLCAYFLVNYLFQSISFTLE